MDGHNNVGELIRQITDSAGMVYLNRVHQRSFSLNVFRMNAVELIEAAQRLKDPDQGISLMSVENKEAGLHEPPRFSRRLLGLS